MIYYNEHPIMWVYERGCVIGVIDNKNPIFSEKYHLYICTSVHWHERRRFLIVFICKVLFRLSMRLA